MSAPNAAALLPLAESIADGAPIDWDAAEAGASERDLAVIRQLRVLSNLAGLHRSLPDGASDAPHASPARQPVAAPAIGSWAHLALIERLGGGTFGDVYRAWDRHLEREVALKLLRHSESIDDLRASRIATEGRLLARVRHANVITVHGVDAHDGRVGLWMELVRGVTLEQQVVARGPLSAREAAAVGIDLCRALAAIHAAGLIHRDVKAQNVMREDGGRIVLMDLGTGREADAGGRRAVPDLAGTPLYLAPEIFSGAPASERTDLYSLGVLLYHLVTGSFPVRATTVQELHAGHNQGRGVRLRDTRADLPTAFVRVVDRAIASDPSKRYESAGALEADLVEALGDASKGTTVGIGTEPRRSRLNRSRAGILLATLAAMLAVAAVGWPTLRGRRAPAIAAGTIRSIAVLPLINMSGDPSQEYFADGMTDELIGTLGQLDGINVISRTSAMQVKGSQRPLPEIARALHVDAVIEGSVRVFPGNPTSDPIGTKRVRINARLIYAGTDTQLWDRTFEKVVSDVFALQSEVAKAVADGINLQMTSHQQRSLTRGAGGALQVSKNARTVNPQAYDAYLRGRYLWNKRTPENLRAAIDEFKKAIDFDPTYPVAWAGLADGYSHLAYFDEQPPREATPLGKAAAKKALELDDSLAEAHASLGLIEWFDDWDSKAAEHEFDRALTLNPNYATAHEWRGLYLNEVGRFSEGIAELERAQELDPLSLVIQANVARSYYFARRYDRAMELFEQLERKEPNFWVVHAFLGQTYLATGKFADAIRELARARELSPSVMRNLGVLGDAYARAGQRAEALQLLGELSALSRRRYVPPIYLAMIHMGLGNKPQTFALLDKAYVERSDWIMQLNIEPEFDPIRKEPRFRELIRRANQGR